MDTHGTFFFKMLFFTFQCFDLPFFFSICKLLNAVFYKFYNILHVSCSSGRKQNKTTHDFVALKLGTEYG